MMGYSSTESVIVRWYATKNNKMMTMKDEKNTLSLSSKEESPICNIIYEIEREKWAHGGFWHARIVNTPSGMLKH